MNECYMHFMFEKNTYKHNCHDDDIDRDSCDIRNMFMKEE